MNRPLSIALILIAITAGATGVSAQQTYRCGNTYSQRPCPGGVLVDAADPRSTEQKAQADAATARDHRTAAEMEKSRLAQERANQAANAPAQGQTAKSGAAGSSAPTMVKPGKHKKGTDYFTAQVPGEKRKSASAKKGKKKSSAALGKKKRSAGKRQRPASGA